MRHATLARGLVGTLLVLAAQTASATLLDGKQLQFQHLFPDSSTAVDSAIFTVGPGVEHTSGIFSVDVSDTSIYLDFLTDCNCYWNTGLFNGPSFFDVFATIDPFTSVSLTTNMPGLTPSHVAFDADHILVDWRGLPYQFDGSLLDSDTFVRLDIVGGNPVPEPGSLTLLGLGLVGAGRARRRRVGD